ncbi:BREX-3 system phosphatase PglZ [Mesorhizobium sp. BR115XR7A]|uniref:BREX-3 system phosphatase PglZ n=1 Tax=Mesorhizobium sp. BR115XR7A TaxID=2876645 RepID=UPI001CCCDA2C|nr:BREX-3 system phosphatase PglZ [Mesorhizobium sp. BR115XR7A]MBZ9908079.1 BREX-3 system phosphatase PglZ [Mesorhizobium sp. BR115XR7A]MBZ9931377.1 BREX-3 system phosphatase PglZ [Mesorhizobium sp. BR1-1-5]
MSLWIERILKEFPSELSRFWIAADPDDVLLDERILASLRTQGFELLPFEDSVMFRTYYEERYRAAWDRGERGPAEALVLHLRSGATGDLPWDYLRDGRRVSLGLADLFPKLSYGVVRQIGSEHLEALFDAQLRHATQTFGEAGTKDFILTHIFGVSPYLISRPEALWRELLRLHFSDMMLPPALASHVANILNGQGVFKGLPLESLLSSKAYFLRVVQDAWDQFLEQNGVTGSRSVDLIQSKHEAAPIIPFEHPDIRAIVDSMFLDGTLHPLAIEGRPTGLPGWAKIGIVEDPDSLAKRVAEGALRLAGSLPGTEASHRDWAQMSRRLAEVIFRFHSLPPVQAEPIGDQVLEVQKAADERLREWVTAHYADLPSLPAAKGPVMVHHVLRFLSMRRDAGETRVALLVFDGLAMDQWVQIRDSLAQRAPELTFEENACFAWLPTLTSVSRQALFSGLKPREFANSIETTSQEPVLWSRFWQDHGLRANEVIYRKGIKRTDQLSEIEAVIADPAIKAAGIVVDTIDEIVHGSVLGKRGIANQIESWCDSGFFERLFAMLLNKGFHIYLTADHGNVEAVGIGRLNQGVATELRGVRARTYRSEAIAASTPGDIDAFRLDIAGLPDDFLPLFAGGRGAFVQKGEPIVAHGGLSVEELIVPFVKVFHASKSI